MEIYDTLIRVEIRLYFPAVEELPEWVMDEFSYGRLTAVPESKGLTFGESHATMDQVECDDVLAHERLTEIAIHNHIGDYDRAVDGNARRDLVR